MGTPSVSLSYTDAASWLDRMGAETGVREAFAGALIEELRLWPEHSSLRLTMALERPAEETLPYEALRKTLMAAGLKEVELRVRYPEGAASLGEYLALHFEDLRAGLRRDLGLDGHWTLGLDYRLEDDDSETVRILAAGALAMRALRERRASALLAERLEWGCGLRAVVELEEAAAQEPAGLEAPLAAPLLPRLPVLPLRLPALRPRTRPPLPAPEPLRSPCPPCQNGSCWGAPSPPSRSGPSPR